MDFIELLNELAARNERLLAACQKIGEGIAELQAAFKGTAEGTRPAPSIDALSERQREIFKMIGAEMSVADIAKKLSLSKRTVEAHRDQIRKRLNFPSVAELNTFAKTYDKG